MNLKRLDYFCQLARVGNFTRAANQIGIAQSALSIAMKKLELELGLTLINRAEKNDLLTSEGKVLYKSASLLLAQAEQVKIELQELKDLDSGTIKVGISAMMGSYYLPEVLLAFKQAYPNIKIQLVDQGTEALKSMLLNGELDLALIRSDQEDNQLRYIALIEEAMVAGVSKHHPFTQLTSVSLKKFCQQPLVLFLDGYFLREAISQYSKSKQQKLDIRMETNLIELQKSLVKNDIGITTCLAKILENETAMVAIPFKPEIILKFGLAWKSSHSLSKASKAFVNFLQKQMSSA